MADYLQIGVTSFKDLFEYLTDRSKTKDVIKNALLRELRDNLKLLDHRDKKGVNINAIIDGLTTSATEDAYKNNFNFNKLIAKNKKLPAELILNKRQEKYIGWDCKRFIYSIEGKIKDIKNLPRLYSDLAQAPINLNVRMDNLFYQVLLLVLFIKKTTESD
jgi:3',5'-cyclic AMP phosphodiesterase CpdA